VDVSNTEVSRSHVSKRGSHSRLTSNVDRTAWKKGFDLVLYLLFCALVGTGFLLAYRLPRGPGADQTVFLGFARHEWGDIHTWLAYAAIGVAAVHLLLNWRWLLKVAGSKGLWRLIVGLLTGWLIIGIFLSVPVKKSAHARVENKEEESVHLLKVD
jgi:hypothetical protein